MIALEFAGQPPARNKMAQAGYEAEKQLAFYLDRAFREAAHEFRVFHGLRVERQGDVAQIDHLVLHRYGFVLVESKSIVESVEINAHGEFNRIFRGRRQGMRSPILQAEGQRDILKLLLNDHKEKLRPKAGLGLLKQQGEFGDQRFMVIAAISDKGRIECRGARPTQVMKAESVVQKIKEKVAFQQSLDGIGGIASTLLSRQRSRDWDEHFVHAFTNTEIDAITQFLLDQHKPRKCSTGSPPCKPSAISDVEDSSDLSSPVADHPSDPAAAAVATPPAAMPRKGPARNMARWSSEEEDRLRKAFNAGRKPADIAKEFGRTAKALRLRAQRLGLITDVTDWQ